MGETSELTEDGTTAYNDVYTDVFGYDGAFNPTEFSLEGGQADPTYNGDNQDKRSTFDGAGNPTAYSNGIASGQFTFDPEDRLTGIVSPAFSAAYDGDGLRGDKTAAGVTTYYLYDGDGQPVLEETYNASTSQASLSAVNLFGADGWRARYYPGGGGQFFAYSFDPQGNVIQRQNSGNTLGYTYDTASYEGYGRRGADYTSGGVNPAPHQDPAGFGGQFGYYGDHETGRSTTLLGLLCLTHRYYDPGTGRFVTRDPSGYGGGINLYGFAGDNPVNESDPSGLNPLSDWLSGLFNNGRSSHDYGTAFGSDRSIQDEAELDHLDDPSHVQYMDAYGKINARNRTRSFAYQGHEYDNANVFMGLVPGMGEEGVGAQVIARTVTRRYGVLQCQECSIALIEAFRKANIHGELIELKGGSDLIVSNAHGMQEAISQNGRHLGVKVGNMVYDNIHKTGIAYDDWLKDFDSLGGIKVHFVTPF